MAVSPFHLASLLSVREAARDQRRLRLTESRRADEELLGKLAQLDTERQRLEAECRTAAAPGRLDVNRWLLAHHSAIALQTEEAAVQERRRTLASEIQRRREELLASDREVRALEKLRERRHRQHRLLEERQHIKQLDEIAARASQYP